MIQRILNTVFNSPDEVVCKMRNENELPVFPLWLRLILSLFFLVFVIVYGYQRGPVNFLWFSDIAFFLIIIAIWLNSSLLVSMAALSVLLFEIIWNLDFFSKLVFGSHLFGLDATAYMFADENWRTIKILSFLLHVSLPVLMIYMLSKLGYHRQAWKAQVFVLLFILPVCYLFTDPERNINWVFGPNSIQSDMPGWAYLFMQMILIPVVIYLPTHLFLSHFFRRLK